jgi:hypothetical protein
MTLTEFLRARVAEDEQRAQVSIDHHEADEPWGYAHLEGDGPHIAAWSPWRVLEECRAKRELVELHDENSSIPGRETLSCWVCGDDYPCQTLRIMAIPYADHPQFHPGWRP